MEIKVKNLSISFDNQKILDDTNLTFTSGHIYGFMGRNGSGKTVLFKCICGFYVPDQGEIYLDDKELHRDMEFMPDMGFLIERPGFISGATGFDNLRYIASIRHLIGKDQIRTAIRRVGLNPNSNKKVGKYSLGMKQRLGTAQAIMENPDILILDEPMNGLDDSGVELMRNLFMELRQEGKLILIASHYKEDLDIICDEKYYVRNGHIVLEK